MQCFDYRTFDEGMKMSELEDNLLGLISKHSKLPPRSGIQHVSLDRVVDEASKSTNNENFPTQCFQLVVPLFLLFCCRNL